MTEDRKKLIDKFQKWLDTKPRQQIIAAQCATIAEEYHTEQLRLGVVSHQRELLNGFRDFVNKRPNSEHVYNYDIEDYLKTIL